MSDKYKIRDNDKAYFITSTIVGWIDVFTRPNHKMLIVQSLRHLIARTRWRGHSSVPDATRQSR
jgi:hypothetical protein